MTATLENQLWSSGAEGARVKLKVKNERRFLELCLLRSDLDREGGSRAEWLWLAGEFEVCGAKHNAHAARQKARRFK
jgi:hypothetical protein